MDDPREFPTWQAFAALDDCPQSLHPLDENRFAEFVVELHLDGQSCPDFIGMVADAWPDADPEMRSDLSAKLETLCEFGLAVLAKAPN